MPEQKDNPSGGNRRRKRCIAAVLGVLVLAVAAVAGSQVPAVLRMAKLDDANPTVRAEAARKLGGRRNYIALRHIREMITRDSSAEVREAAAYAAMKMQDQEAVQPIMAAVRSRPDEDSEFTAKTISYLAMLTGMTPETRAFLAECEATGKPFRQIGVAMARIEAYEGAGMTQMLAIAGQAKGDMLGYVQNRVEFYLPPVLQMLGLPMTVGDLANAGQRDAIQAWWRENGSDRLLRDALRYRLRRDEDVRAIERLEHARENVGKALGTL